MFSLTIRRHISGGIHDHFRSLSAAALSLLLSISANTFAQEDWKDKRGRERFESLAWLEGEWQGYGKFSDRVTYIRKHYSFELAMPDKDFNVVERLQMKRVR
jgi:hypothetical protein